jgi:hypothetical protein
MKKFKKCPVCDCDAFIRRTYSSSWFEEHCDNCDAQFSQHFSDSFDDEDIHYTTFYTKDFYYYVYYKESFSTKSGTTNIYNRIFPRGESVQSPMLTYKKFDINYKELDKLNEKFKTLALFK